MMIFYLLVLLLFFPVSLFASGMCLVDSDQNEVLINGSKYSPPAVLVDCCKQVSVSHDSSFCFADTGVCRFLKPGEIYDFSRNKGYCSNKSDIGVLLKLKKILMAEASVQFAMHRGLMHDARKSFSDHQKVLRYEGKVIFTDNMSILFPLKRSSKKSQELDILSLQPGQVQIKLCKNTNCVEQTLNIIEPSIELKKELMELSNLERKIFFIKQDYLLNAMAE